jgi:nucleoside-diphosphate-sugar epimerase
VEKVVFASSASLYGDTDQLPINENLRLDPISPYAVSKYAAEAYMVSYNRVYGMNTTALRYFNVFGPRQKDSPYSGVIAIFIGRIFDGQNITIFGDGSQTRDFVYVKDVVKANICAAESKAAAGKVVNVGSGKTISLLDLTKLMIEYSEKKGIEIKFGPVREGDILHSSANVELAKNLMDFTADYDAITGFKEYLEYYKNKYGK